ncbi:MAG: phosphoribosyltransferase [Bacteroidetes bacterium]|jgi:pyrimidine operon attenuation protein / uracil phosphoribosyltransferase|nr:phosphoribosyltransferase [Bacteroidota bacterium]
MSELKQTLILDHEAIQQKITRMAWQILEDNYNAKKLVVLGIEKKGSIVSKLLVDVLSTISSLDLHQGSIKIDKDNPTMNGISVRCDTDLTNSHVVLVDDVLNSGKTLMYATLPILAQNPHQLQTAILANRDHTRFPIKADFVGISLATTLQEHIQFTQNKKGKMTVHLL